MSPKKREIFETIDNTNNTWTLSPENPTCTKPFYFSTLTLSLSANNEVRIDEISDRAVTIEYINENQFGNFLTKNTPINYGIVLWDKGLSRTTIKGEMFEEEGGIVRVVIVDCDAFELLSERARSR